MLKDPVTSKKPLFWLNILRTIWIILVFLAAPRLMSLVASVVGIDRKKRLATNSKVNKNNAKVHCVTPASFPFHLHHLVLVSELRSEHPNSQSS